MPRSRRRKKRIGYETLENRRLLAGDTAFFFDTTSGTLFVAAAETNVAGAEFANEITFSNDSANSELVVTETNRPEQRFSTDGLNVISYRGTFNNDRVVNTTDIDTRIIAFAGDDSITTGGGNDRVVGGNGNDIIRTGDGDDTVAGGGGDDQILESDTDTGADRFLGGAGNDIIETGGEDDFVSGQEGDDIIRLGDGNDVVIAGDGNDEIFGGNGRDLVFGGLGDDIINGEDGRDRILGQGGNDTISGGLGNDVLLGGDGEDSILGEDGNDTLVGGEDNDTLNAGVGADRIFSAAVTSSNNSFGQDTIITGGDTDVDFVTGHPSDIVFGASEDILIDVNVIRIAEQLDYLETNRERPGFNVTDSGLQFRIVTPGTGDFPSASDRVRVNYSGTFIDGVPFDVRDDIAFGLNQVIAGWTEGLQLVREGGTIELVIPASLAYGDNGIPSVIPGSATLLFTVDLLEIV